MNRQREETFAEPPGENVRQIALRHAGFPPVLAADIACSRADVTLAIALVEAGCDAETAAKIVS